MKMQGNIIDHPYSLQAFIADHAVNVLLLLILCWAACVIFSWLDRP